MPIADKQLAQLQHDGAFSKNSRSQYAWRQPTTSHSHSESCAALQLLSSAALVSCMQRPGYACAPSCHLHECSVPANQADPLC